MPGSSTGNSVSPRPGRDAPATDLTHQTENMTNHVSNVPESVSIHACIGPSMRVGHRVPEGLWGGVCKTCSMRSSKGVPNVPHIYFGNAPEVHGEV